MLCFRPATQNQVIGHQGGLQKGYQTVEAANDTWAHGLATQSAYGSGILGPTPTRKRQTRKQPAKTVASVEEIALRAAGLSLSCEEVRPRTSRQVNAQRSSPSPSTNSKCCPLPSISTPLPSYPAAYAKNTKLTQSVAGPSVQSQASPSMQTISDPWWVVVQGSYPGVYHERYVVHYTLFPYYLCPLRYQAQAALGAEEPRAIEKAGSLVIANQIFVTEYMQGHIIQNFY
jgi:hypothetical protein